MSHAHRVENLEHEEGRPWTISVSGSPARSTVLMTTPPVSRRRNTNLARRQAAAFEAIQTAATYTALLRWNMSVSTYPYNVTTDVIVIECDPERLPEVLEVVDGILGGNYTPADDLVRWALIDVEKRDRFGAHWTDNLADGLLAIRATEETWRRSPTSSEHGQHEGTRRHWNAEDDDKGHAMNFTTPAKHQKLSHEAWIADEAKRLKWR